MRSYLKTMTFWPKLMHLRSSNLFSFTFCNDGYCLTCCDYYFSPWRQLQWYDFPTLMFPFPKWSFPLNVPPKINFFSTSSSFHTGRLLSHHHQLTPISIRLKIFALSRLFFFSSSRLFHNSGFSWHQGAHFQLKKKKSRGTDWKKKWNIKAIRDGPKNPGQNVLL